MSPETPARIRVLAGAALFSTAGAAIKACSFDGWQTAGLRSLFAGLTVFLLMPGSRRGWTPKVVPVAVIYAATLVLFVLAATVGVNVGYVVVQTNDSVSSEWKNAAVFAVTAFKVVLSSVVIPDAASKASEAVFPFFDSRETTTRRSSLFGGRNEERWKFHFRIGWR